MRATQRMAVAALALSAVGLATMGTAGAAETPSDPHYTDGTTWEGQANYGAPPEAPFISKDGKQICIDPPSFVWMTLHYSTDGELSSRTFPYEYQEGNRFVCVDWTPPVCPVKRVTVYGTYNIGTGRGPVLTVDVPQDACPPPPPPPPPPPVEPPVVVPPVVTAVPAAVVVANPVVAKVTGPQLAMTGARETTGEAIIGTMLVVGGLALARRSRSVRGLIR